MLDDPELREIMNQTYGNPMTEGNIKDLIEEAQAMLLDRTKEEQDLIYIISKLGNEERLGIIIAYEILHGKDDD